MKIFPAIDIKEGSVVRLIQGDFKRKTVYSKDPLKTALHWIKQGAEVLHIVDLDGAATGKPQNLQAVKKIVRETGIPVQLGGGMRSWELIKEAIEAGVWRVVLGTRAADDHAFLRKVLKSWGDKIIVSIDAKDGQVCIKGWDKAVQGVDAFSFGRLLKECGLKEVIYTDISKDGMLKGPHIAGIKRMIKESGLKVIASGGIGSLDDIRKLKALEKTGVTGIIVGKALYEAKFTLTQALKIAA